MFINVDLRLRLDLFGVTDCVATLRMWVECSLFLVCSLLTCGFVDLDDLKLFVGCR